jgi:hypothetical protein
MFKPGFVDTPMLRKSPRSGYLAACAILESGRDFVVGLCARVASVQRNTGVNIAISILRVSMIEKTFFSIEERDEDDGEM